MKMRNDNKKIRIRSNKLKKVQLQKLKYYNGLELLKRDTIIHGKKYALVFGDNRKSYADKTIKYWKEQVFNKGSLVVEVDPRRFGFRYAVYRQK
jgi:hypothetical protein